MGKIIKVREVGDPVLNKMSKEVDITNINSDVLDIIDDLKATLEDGVGVGIAAPQIGINKRIIVVEAKKENGIIVLTDIENKRRKWVFAKIEENNFHWQDVTVKEDGEWHINFDLYAERI